VNGNVVGQRYRMARMIGAGGMGSVHEATDTVTGTRVAVKLITAEMAKNPTLMGRFSREARAAATIDTPHIVKVLDAGTDEASGLPFLAMELLEGEDVQQLIRRLGPLPPDLALRVVAQACLGLDRAHEARIIHRDIKPANFFLAKTADGQRVVKLLDFGIAKITRDADDATGETAGLTRTGSMLGSPLYMSPEQARGHKNLDRRADLWSLGVVLYQALTGRTPHQDTDALGELIIAICTEEATAIQELAPWVPPDIAAVAHRAMRFAPAERYQTAGEMLDAIRPLLPSGWAIDDSMFQPLREVDRDQVQPRLITQPDMPIPRAGRTTTPGAITAASPGASSKPVIEAATPMPEPSGATMQSIQAYGTTVGRGGSARPGPASRPRTALIAGAAAAVVALGAGAYSLTRSSAAGPGVLPAPTSTVVAPAEVKPRTVKVDGAVVKANDGAIEITGAIGSVHKVKVTTGDGETLKDVAITEGGAIPPKVDGPAPKPGAPKPPKPSGPPSSPAPPPPSPLRLQR
jgi:eukaryotic-like serine/threonine-protein kinase